jgi:hypothetical protein
MRVEKHAAESIFVRFGTELQRGWPDERSGWVHAFPAFVPSDAAIAAIAS